MIVEPKSGWRISSTATIATITRRQGEDRQRLVALPQAQQPGHRHDEEGLQELRRLEQADAEVEPALGPVHLGAEQGTSASATMQTSAPISDSRRRLSRGCIEMRIITGIDRPIQMIWR